MVTSRAGQGKLNIVSSYKGRPAYEKRCQFEDTFSFFVFEAVYFILYYWPTHYFGNLPHFPISKFFIFY